MGGKHSRILISEKFQRDNDIKADIVFSKESLTSNCNYNLYMQDETKIYIKITHRVETFGSIKKHFYVIAEFCNNKFVILYPNDYNDIINHLDYFIYPIIILAKDCKLGPPFVKNKNCYLYNFPPNIKLLWI